MDRYFRYPDVSRHTYDDIDFFLFNLYQGIYFSENISITNRGKRELIAYTVEKKLIYKRSTLIRNTEIMTE